MQAGGTGEEKKERVCSRGIENSFPTHIPEHFIAEIMEARLWLYAMFYLYR